MKTSSHLPKINLLRLIEEARKAEKSRDIESLRTILNPIWSDFDALPDVSEMELQIQAEILRICGFFLTFFGKTKNLRNFHQKAKDFLTNSIDLFERAGLPEKVAEANVILAFCFWNNSEIGNCKAVLEMAEMEFSDNPLHPVFLQIKINRLMTLLASNDKASNRIAGKLIDEISDLVKFCSDARLCALFHIEVGIYYLFSQKYQTAEFHFKEVYRFAKQSNDQFTIAMNYNNLSQVYRETNQISEAFAAIDKSLEILCSLNQPGSLAHVLDSRASIYLDCGQARKALKTAEKAIDIFSKGDDCNGLLSALWTKCICFIKLDQKDQAVETFVTLQSIAVQFDEETYKKYQKLFADEIYFINDLPLDESEADFRKSRVSSAIRKSGGVSKKAAEILGIDRGQMTDILTVQYPIGTFEADGYIPRIRRSKVKGKNAEGRTHTLKPKDIWQEKITKLSFDNELCAFEFDYRSASNEIYHFGRGDMIKFGIESEGFVAVSPLREYVTGEVILVLHEDSFIAGDIRYDEEFNLFMIFDKDDCPVFLDESNVIGKPVGFCEDSGEAQRIYKFRGLNI